MARFDDKTGERLDPEKPAQLNLKPEDQPKPQQPQPQPDKGATSPRKGGK